jgi:quinol monooxygenase YgiN
VTGAATDAATDAVIVVAASLSIDPAQREELAALLGEVAVATRAEPGCRAYRVAVDLEAPHRFWVLEEWASDAALEAHLATAHVGRFWTALTRLRVAGVSVDRYVVASKRKVI